MIREYDMVKAIEKINDNVDKDCIGTIVMVYGDSGDYEVEFFNDDNETIDVLTVNERQLNRI